MGCSRRRLVVLCHKLCVNCVQLVQGPHHVGHLGARRERVLAHGLEHLRRADHELPRDVARGVAVQVEFVKARTLKSGNHLIGLMVETRRLSSYGSTGLNLQSPALVIIIFCARATFSDGISMPRRSGTSCEFEKSKVCKQVFTMGQGAGSRVGTRRFQAMGHDWIPELVQIPTEVAARHHDVAVQVAFESSKL
jgi:hypothetical protein